MQYFLDFLPAIVAIAVSVQIHTLFLIQGIISICYVRLVILRTVLKASVERNL